MKMITLSLLVIPPIREITGGKYKSGQNLPIIVLLGIMPNDWKR